jgi:hypothetical protein
MERWFNISLKYLALATFVFSVWTYFDKIRLDNRHRAIEKIQQYIDLYSTGKPSEDNQLIATFYRRFGEFILCCQIGWKCWFREEPTER